MTEPRTTRRRYTAAQKAHAVGVAVAKGQTAASEETGIPLSTLHRWFASPEMAELRTTAREDVAEQMWIAVQVGVGQMVEGLKDKRVPLRDKTVAVSMLSEKYLLLTGQATSRSEHRDLGAGLDDHETEQLRKAIDDWRRNRAATE